jgi:hypothetical protein
VSLRHWIYGLESSTALEPRPGHRPLVPHPRDPAQLAGRVQVRDPPPRRRSGSRTRSTRTARNDPFGANSVLQGEGYEVPEWTRPDPTARPGTLEPFKPSEPRPRRAPRAGLPARALPQDAALPAARRARRQRLPEVRGHEDVLDNLIHRLEIPELIAPSPTRPTACASTPTTSPRALPHRGARARAQRRFPLSTRPAARCLMGASFGAGGGALHGVRYPGVWGRLLLQSGSVRLHRHRPAQPPRPALRPRRRVRQRLPRRPVADERARLRELRRVRVAHLREPLARAAARRPPGCRCASSRRATATTGRTGATACARASPGCSPGRSCSSTSNHHPEPQGERRMADTRRNIGLSLGADICWPLCFEHIMKRLDLKLPTGATRSLRGRARDHRALRPAPAGKYDLVVDRLTHWYHTSREWIKKGIVMNDSTCSTTRGASRPTRSTPATAP